MNLQILDKTNRLLSPGFPHVFKDARSAVLSLSTIAAASYVLFNLALPSKPRHPNLPPIVPYSIPYVGNGLELRKDARSFINRCKEKYGPVFQIYSFGRTMVVVTGMYIAECFKAGDKYLDLDEGLIDILPVARIVDVSYDKRKRQTGNGFDPTKNPLIRTLRNRFKTHHLDMFHERIAYAVDKGIQQDIVFQPGENSTVIDIADVQHVIVRVTGQVFAGKDAAENKQLLEAMSAYSQSIFSASLFYVLFPPVIADFITRHFLSVGKHIDVMMKVMTPILDEIKMREDSEGICESADFMHMMLHTPNAKDDIPTTAEVAFWLQDIAFASIHTTSLFTTFALHNLSDRPDIQALIRQEIDDIKQKYGGLVPEAVKDMLVIDSILRETLRVGGDYIGINHKAMQDTTLSNGTVIPKGLSVGMAVNDAHTDPVIQGATDGDLPLTEIDPLRYVKRRSKKSTSVGPDLLVFGIGYHACPGRYFAKQEICYLLARLVDQFDITAVTKSGKRARNSLALGIIQLAPEHGVRLTKRTSRRCYDLHTNHT